MLFKKKWQSLIRILYLDIIELAYFFCEVCFRIHIGLIVLMKEVIREREREK